MPISNEIYSLGSVTKKIKDLYLSSNSLWIGDKNKIDVTTEGKIRFKKIKEGSDFVPSYLKNTDGIGYSRGDDDAQKNVNDWITTLQDEGDYSGSLDINTIFADDDDFEDILSVENIFTVTVENSKYLIDGDETPKLILKPGLTYKFDQSHNSNLGHPLRFFLSENNNSSNLYDDTHSSYTNTNVSYIGTLGSSGAYTRITVTANTPQNLYYTCNQSGDHEMGNNKFNITILKDTLPVRNGGTGIGTYAVGDILYASATDTLSKLGIGSVGETLKISSSGLPEWGAGLADVTGETSIGTNAQSSVGVGTTTQHLTLNSQNLNLNFTGNNLSLNGTTPGTAGQVIKYDGQDIVWDMGGSATVDVSEATGIGTNLGIGSNITMGNSLVGLNINCVSFNLNIGTDLPANGQYLRYDTNSGSAKWQSLDNQTLNNQILNVFAGNCSKSSTSTFTGSTIEFPTITTTNNIIQGIDLNSGNLLGIGTHRIINNYKKSSGVEKVLIDYGFSMYDTNITTKLEMELHVNGSVLQKSDVLSKTLSGNQSKKINKQFIINTSDLNDVDVNNNIDICFIDHSGTSSNNIYLFTDNHSNTHGDNDVNITLTEIGTTNTLYGSSINGLPVGDTNPSTGKFTTLENTGVMTMSNHIIPSSNAAFDLGNAEYKIRHLFLSDNSLWIGDNYKLGIDGQKLAIRKRDIHVVPKIFKDKSISMNDIKELVGKDNVADSELNLQDFVKAAINSPAIDHNQEDISINTLFKFDETNSVDKTFEDVDIFNSDTLSVATNGQVQASKAIVADDSSNISGLNSISAINLTLTGSLNIPNNSIKTSELDNDSGFLTSTSNIIYNDLSDKPTIPTNTNQLTNGSGFLTSSSNLSASRLTGTINPARLATGGSTNQVLKKTDSGMMWANESGGGSSVWSQSGSTITTNNNVGIKTTNPVSPLHIYTTHSNNNLTANTTLITLESEHTDSDASTTKFSPISIDFDVYQQSKTQWVGMPARARIIGYMTPEGMSSNRYGERSSALVFSTQYSYSARDSSEYAIVPLEERIVITNQTTIKSNLTVNGNIYASGNITSSDNRLKKNESVLVNCLSTVLKLQPQIYTKIILENHSRYIGECPTYIDENGEIQKDYNNWPTEDYTVDIESIDSGFIAQDTYNNVSELRHLVSIDETILNNSNNFDENGNLIEDVVDNNGNPSYLAINYTGIIPYLVGAIKELNTNHVNETTQLKTEIDSLKTTISTLESQFNTLQTQMNTLLNR